MEEDVDIFDNSSEMDERLGLGKSEEVEDKGGADEADNLLAIDDEVELLDFGLWSSEVV